ncbi:MAG: hypothetical protein ACTSRD_13115, partial [Promethearchaeota archaeon]
SNEILLPVNLREILNLPPTAFGLYVSTIDLSLPYKKGKKFWNFVEECHQIILKNMDRDNLLNLLGRMLDIPEQIIDAAFFAKYGFVDDWFLNLCLRATKLDKINYSYSISNLGKVPFPSRYGDLELQEVHCHTYGEMAEKQLVITTVVKKMTIDISFLDSVIKKEDMERIRDIALGYLNS